MVQIGSSAEYDGFMEDYHSQNGNDAPADDGLRAAVRGLIESVNATSRHLADAADSFAKETVRVMEGFVARVDSSAGETRDLAGLAGRAADEARRISEEARGQMEGTREQMRAEVESMIAGVRAQLDEALRSTAESVEGARQAAEDADRRSRETGEKVEQSLVASQQAAMAAEAAAEAARRSAEGIEQAVAEARQQLRDEALQLHDETSARVEQALAASREAASAAERAAEDARNASLQAMARAVDAAAPAPAVNDAAHQLLDRLEADYAMLTQLVQSLHSHVAGLPAPAAAQAEASDEQSPPGDWQVADESGDIAAERDGQPSLVLWSRAAEPAEVGEVERVAWNAETETSARMAESEAAAPSPAGAFDNWAGRTESTDEETHSPQVAPEPAWDASVAEAAEALPVAFEAEAASWEAAKPEEPAAEIGTWWPVPSTTEVENESAAAPAMETSYEEAPAAAEAEPSPWAAPEAGSESIDRNPWWSATANAEPKAETAWAPPAAAHEEGVWRDEAAVQAEAVAETASDEDAASPPSSWHWSPSETAGEPSEATPYADSGLAAEMEPAALVSSEASAEPESHDDSEEQAVPGPGLVLSGRVILNISPVPDFDRLLNLDGALGRISSIETVTLADYAKEKVTFRVEMNHETSVVDLARDLAEASNQPVEVAAAEPGELQLRIAQAA